MTERRKNTLQRCSISGYPSRTIDKVKWDIVEKSWKGKTKKGSDQRGKHKGLVVVPYVKGLSEDTREY